MALTVIVVTAKFLPPDPTASAASGTVLFSLNEELQDPSDHETVGPITRLVQLDASGALSVELYANNDPGTLPSGSRYHVTERIVGAPGREYDIIVPYDAAGATIDLSEFS